jgi:hypothetical protein
MTMVAAIFQFLVVKQKIVLEGLRKERAMRSRHENAAWN